MFGLKKIRHGISIVETCYQFSSRKVDAQSVMNWIVVGQLSWQYLRAPTLDRCSLSQRSSSSVYSTIPSRGSISDSWYSSTACECGRMIWLPLRPIVWQATVRWFPGAGHCRHAKRSHSHADLYRPTAPHHPHSYLAAYVIAVCQPARSIGTYNNAQVCVTCAANYASVWRTALAHWLWRQRRDFSSIRRWICSKLHSIFGDLKKSMFSLWPTVFSGAGKTRVDLDHHIVSYHMHIYRAPNRQTNLNKRINKIKDDTCKNECEYKK